MKLNMNALLFKHNVEHEIQQVEGTQAGARYECIYKNLLREIRQYYSIKFEEFIQSKIVSQFKYNQLKYFMFPHFIVEFTLANFPKATVQPFLAEPNEQVDDCTYWKFIRDLAHFLGCFILPKYMIKSFLVCGRKIPEEYNNMKFEYQRYQK